MARPNSFGVVAEGTTDVEVIRNVVVGLLKDPDALVHTIRPEAGEKGLRGWTEVLNYLRNREFIESVKWNSGVIVSIDTDTAVLDGLGVNCHQPSAEPESIEQLVHRVRAVLESAIGPMHPEISNKVVFAIAVEKLECWVLMAVDSEQPDNVTDPCDQMLVAHLQSKGEPINETHPLKTGRRYAMLTAPLRNMKNIQSLSARNRSFQLFVESLGRSVESDSQA